MNGALHANLIQSLTAGFGAPREDAAGGGDLVWHGPDFEVHLRIRDGVPVVLIRATTAGRGTGSRLQFTEVHAEGQIQILSRYLQDLASDRFKPARVPGRDAGTPPRHHPESPAMQDPAPSQVESGRASLLEDRQR